MANYLKQKNMMGLNFGHVTIKKDGIECNCGKRGCFERYGSMRVLKDGIRFKNNMEKLSSQEIHDIIKYKFESIGDLVNSYIENLAIGIANYIDIFEPECISIRRKFYIL